MPEQPNLTHVATTLQFCLEQLQLCASASQRICHGEIAGIAGTVNVLSEDAITYVEAALSRLSLAGIQPAPLRTQPEGAVPA